MGLQNVYFHCLSKALTNSHRQLLWLSGEQAWCYSQLVTLKPQLLEKNSAAVHSKEIHSGYFSVQENSHICRTQINNKECYRYLGQEFEVIIFDAHSGLNPDQLAQISGTLKAGGVLIFVTPDIEQWPYWDEPELDNLWAQPFTKGQVTRNFLDWVKQQLLVDQELVQVSQLNPVAHPQSSYPNDSKKAYISSQVALTAQADLIEQCYAFILENKRAHAVIMAPRGRGKSAALGLLAKRLKSQKQILITASDKLAVMQVEKFCDAPVRFLTPHQLLSNALIVEKDMLLLIDESASISVDILVAIVNRFSQIVFSTTTQGYEGTGQGFKLRFLKYIEESASPFKLFNLDKPMRWAEGDPVESWLYNILLLNVGKQNEISAGAKTSKTPVNNIDNYVLEKIDTQALIKEPKKLQQLFSLLAQAHYRTAPSDVRIILDSPNMHLWVVIFKEQIIAACVIAIEGPVIDFLVDDKGMDGHQLAIAMYKGSRRPRGNLVPQILIAQEGYLPARQYKFARVVRIATGFEYRRTGIAKELLGRIEAWAIEQECDYLAASFSLQHDLYKFWINQGYSLVRVGNQLDKVTASHNGLVLKPLHRELRLLIELRESFDARFLFQQQRIFNHPQSFDYINTASAQLIPLQTASAKKMLWYKSQLEVFAQDYRPLESIGYYFYVLLNQYFSLWNSKKYSAQSQLLLTIYFFDRLCLENIYVQAKISGYRSLVKHMRKAASDFLKIIP